MNTSKGFTIIELLVVVAIIAVLTGIVLVNVASYINKGKDAAVQGNMSTILTNAAVYYDANGSYTGFLASAGYTTAAAAAAAANGGTAITGAATATAWCACSPLKVTAGDTFCVDSTGAKKTTATACATECPAAAACI